VLTRQLGLADAVVLGMGAMLGAGVFVAFGPATAAAGRAVPLALLLAAAVAWANADSSARLAATLPRSGGIYAYGRERLTPFWGGLAGFAFLIGKTASAGAIAGTAASHLLPRHATAAAIGAVVALTTLAAAGIRRGALATRVVVALVVGVLGAVVASAAGPAVSGLRTLPEGGGPAGAAGALAGAGILFFAFAGYARITTLGEEVRDPERTIPRAITLSLALVLVIYAAVGAALLGVLGTARLAASESPLADLASSVGGGGWGVAIGVTAGIAALASGLGVLLGLSRTTFAMARDGVLPRGLARLDGRPADPRPVRAQVVAGLATILGIVLLDLRQAIVVSSIAVLLYYAIGHLAALTLPGGARRVVPVAGLVGCIAVAVALAAGIPGT
jgi:APA family basic amino acid/polyamine antiporter